MILIVTPSISKAPMTSVSQRRKSSNIQRYYPKDGAHPVPSNALLSHDNRNNNGIDDELPKEIITLNINPRSLYETDTCIKANNNNTTTNNHDKYLKRMDEAIHRPETFLHPGPYELDSSNTNNTFNNSK